MTQGSGPDSPTVYFETCRTYRNVRTAMLILLAGGMSAWFWYLAYFSRQPSPAERSGPSVWIVLPAIMFSVFLATGLYKMIRNVREPARVTWAGVEANGKRHGWGEIREVRANRASFSKCVSVAFQLQNGQFIVLQGDRTMTRKEYDALAATLRETVLPRYPMLQIG